MAAVRKASSLKKEDLQRQGTNLKKVTTKEYCDEPSAEDVEAVSKVFAEKGKNLEELAKHFTVDLQLLQDFPPNDGAEFAKSLFAGVYLRDKTEAAKDQLRQNLTAQINVSKPKLRRAVTRESTGPSSSDLAAAAKIFNDLQGDLTKIAEKCGLVERLLNKDPPYDGDEFAHKVLAGNYTEDSNEVFKNQLREALRPEIVTKKTSLKRSKTRESTGEASAEDIAVVAKMYPADINDLASVAEKMGLKPALVKEKPPTDAEDFARKALEGAYTSDESEVTKKDFRANLLAGILQRRPSLKQAPKTARRMSNVTEEELMNFSSFYTKLNGDLDAIAKESGLPQKLLRDIPPTDADDFVLKLLDGVYTVDMDQQAKQTFRHCLKKEMIAAGAKLKKTHTKSWDGSVNEADVKMFSRVYAQRNGDLAQLAQIFSLSLASMEENPPDNGESFGKNVLLGAYTTDAVAKQIDEFRQGLTGQVKQHGRASLKHTETKPSSTQPSPGQVAKIAMIYNDLKGDLVQAGKAVGADVTAIMKNKPTDGNDFAVKVLSGEYSTEDVEGFRRRLSGLLHQDMANHPGLKQTQTKEKLGEPKEEDITTYAKVFEENDGNLGDIAKSLGCDFVLLRKDAPADARTFAIRYLAGAYQM